MKIDDFSDRKYLRIDFDPSYSFGFRFWNYDGGRIDCHIAYQKVEVKLNMDNFDTLTLDDMRKIGRAIIRQAKIWEAELEVTK